MATYYSRADGTAANKAAAIGPLTDASACMNLALVDSETFTAGDVIEISGLGGDYIGKWPDTVAYITINGNDNPVIDASGNATGVYLALKDGASYSNFSVIGATFRAMFMQAASDVKIDGLNINSLVGATYGIQLTAGTTLKDNCSITNTSFDLDSTIESVRLDIYSSTFNNFKFNSNVVNNGKYGLRFDSTEANAGVGDRSPEFVEVKNNTFNGTLYDSIFTLPGIKWDLTEPGRSIISGNIISNVGTPTTPNVNGVGLQWCRGVIFEDNSVDSVFTSVPDGNGVIVDFAYTDVAYISDGVILRRNKTKNCVAGDGSAGISNFKGANTSIYCNESTYNSSGISIHNVQSTGSSIKNNTLANNVKNCVRIDSPGGGDPGAIPLINNIFYKSDYSVFVTHSVSEPSLTTNCYSGATTEARWNNSTSSTFAAEAGAVEADPLFVDAANGDYNLQESSPCVGVGTKWWGNAPRPESMNGEPLPDTKIDLGANQSTWDENHPANL